MAKRDKTVIILGAGFSCSAGFPKQIHLLSSLNKFFRKKRKKWKQLLSFFNSIFSKSESAFNNFSIEDLFTLFDKCIVDEETFGLNSIEKIEKAYKNLLLAIQDFFICKTRVIEKNYKKLKKRESFKNNLIWFHILVKALLQIRKTYIDPIGKRKENKLKKEIIKVCNNQQFKGLKFQEKILNLIRKYPKMDNDRLSIISLNWDYLLETIINLERSTGVRQDYVIYDYGFSKHKKTPSILLKSKGYTNLKILKLHGSANWGYCTSCKRIYNTFGESIRFNYSKICSHCKTNLIPLMITPTFLKYIDNLHIQQIWQNAYIELSEADRIIFIGYSFRPEDFLFRQLLLKGIQKNSKIYVFQLFEEYLELNKIGTHSIRNRQDLIKEEKKQASIIKNIIPKSGIQVHVFGDGWINNYQNILAIIQEKPIKHELKK